MGGWCAVVLIARNLRACEWMVLRVVIGMEGARMMVLRVVVTGSNGW